MGEWDDAPRIEITGGPDTNGQGGTGMNWGGGDGNTSTNGNGGSGSSGGKTLNSIPGFPNVIDYGPQGFGSDWHSYITRIRDAAVMLVMVRGDGQIQGYNELDPIKKNNMSFGEKKTLSELQVMDYVNAEKSALLGPVLLLPMPVRKSVLTSGGNIVTMLEKLRTISAIFRVKRSAVIMMLWFHSINCWQIHR